MSKHTQCVSCGTGTALHFVAYLFTPNFQWICNILYCLVILCCVLVDCCLLLFIFVSFYRFVCSIWNTNVVYRNIIHSTLYIDRCT